MNHIYGYDALRIAVARASNGFVITDFTEECGHAGNTHVARDVGEVAGILAKLAVTKLVPPGGDK